MLLMQLKSSVMEVRQALSVRMHLEQRMLLASYISMILIRIIQKDYTPEKSPV